MYNELQRNEYLQQREYADRKQRYERTAEDARLAETLKTDNTPTKKSRASIALAIITGAR